MESISIDEYFDENARNVHIDDIIIIDSDEHQVVQLAASRSITLMRLRDSVVYEHLDIKNSRCTLSHIRDMFGANARFKKPSNQVLMSGSLFKSTTTGRISVLVYDTVARQYKVACITDGRIYYRLDNNGQGGINSSNYKDLFGTQVANINVITDDVSLNRFLNNW